MLKQKFYLRLGLTVLFLAAFHAACFAETSTARRIAVLPTVNQTSLKTPDIEAYCANALYQSLHVPLNGVLNVHEYISQDELAAALPDLKSTDRKHKFGPSRLKEAAAALNADLIVGLVITDMGEFQSYSWDGDLILYSYVSMELIGYDRQKDEWIGLKHHKFFHDDYSPSGTLEAIARETADYLIAKADFKKDIFPLSKNNA